MSIAQTSGSPPPPHDPDITAAITRAFAAAPGNLVEIDGTGKPDFPASLIRWLLLEAVAPSGAKLNRIKFRNVRITGVLDLAATSLTLIPSFRDCAFIGPAKDAGICLTDATAIGIEILGGTLAMLEANRLTLTGSLILRSAAIETDDPPDSGGQLTIAHGILLCGATIHGNLDLRGTQITGPLPPLGPAAALLPEPIAILADGLAVDGNLLFSAGARAAGEIRLNGAQIQRDLSFCGAELNNPGGFSLSAAGAEIHGSVFFNTLQGENTARSLGLIRLDGAHIHGNLDFSGAWLTARDYTNPKYERPPNQAASKVEKLYDRYIALSGEGLTVEATLFLSNGFRAEGLVYLIFAKIGNNLDASNASFHLPGEASLCADAAQIDGVADFRFSTSTGLIRLEQAKIGQGVYFGNFGFDQSGESQSLGLLTTDLNPEFGADVCGLAADGATAGGIFQWTDIHVFPLVMARLRPVIFVAAGASVTELKDDQSSWDAADRIDLRDCTYARIAALSRQDDLDWRIDRLDLEYAEWTWKNRAWNNLGFLRRGWHLCRFTKDILGRTRRREHRDGTAGRLGAQVRRFSPGPYMQLASVLHDAGLEQASLQVLLRLERNRTWYGGLDFFHVLWRSLLDAAIGYGSKPFRPIYGAVLPWVIVSWGLFYWFHHDLMEIVRADPKDVTQFSSLFYALESLIPFVDFGQRKAFPIVQMFSCAGFLLLFNTLLGYAAASFLAAGLSGLAKLGKDGDSGA